MPHARLGDGVYQHLTPQVFDPQAGLNGRRVERWTLTLHVDDERQPAAWLTLARGAEDGWRIEESMARARYRGAGLDERLVGQAQAMLGPQAILKQRSPA